MSENAHEKPTLKTIASLSGLAVTTVSRALGDAPDISAKTKARVRQIADEIGYIPNRAGVRLRTGKTNVVSLVLPVEKNMSNHSVRLINAVSEALRGTNYHLNVTYWRDGEDNLNPIRRIVENELADGIITNSTTESDPRVAYMMARNFPFATHGRTKWATSHAYFDFDNAEFVRLAVAQLAARGRKKIGLILPPLDQFFSHHMQEGAMLGARETGIEIVLFENIDADKHNREIEDAMRQNLAIHPDVDAVIASSPIAAMVTTSLLESVGLTIGREIDLYSREAMRFLHLFRPEILLVREDVGKAGNFLGKAILHAIDAPTAPPMQYLDIPQNTDMIIRNMN